MVLYRRVFALAATLAMLVLGACARDVETRVTRFHEGHLPAGGTFVVQPESPDLAGPEFNRYADLVAQEMTRYDYSRTKDPAAADLHVAIGYSVSEGRTKIESRPGYAYPHYRFHVGAFHRPFHYGFYQPHYYDGFLGPDIRSETVYTRRLSMKVRNNETGETLFEGRALSEGPTAEVAQVMPYLVESMFRNFPGESGTTKVVKIETRDGAAY